jgi:hypothetical protein
MKIEIDKKVLFDLINSHSYLSQAEYNRNSSFNDAHYAHKAEMGVINNLDRELLNEYYEYSEQNLLEEIN